MRSVQSAPPHLEALLDSIAEGDAGSTKFQRASKAGGRPRDGDQDGRRRRTARKEEGSNQEEQSS